MGWNKIKNMDIYQKLDDDLQNRTFFGAIISLFAGSLIIYLFFMELWEHLRIEKKQHLVVDLQRNEKLLIHFDVTFPHIPCPLLNLDTSDATGIRQIDLSHHVQKESLDANGNPSGETTKHQ